MLLDGGSGTVSDRTPAVSATSRDRNGDALTYTFVLTTADRDEPVATAERSAPSGETVTWTVPSGVLEDGYVHHLSVSVSDGESTATRTRDLVYRSWWSRAVHGLGELGVRALFWSPATGVALVVLGLALTSAWGRRRLGAWVTAVGLVLGIGGFITLVALLSQIGS